MPGTHQELQSPGSWPVHRRHDLPAASAKTPSAGDGLKAIEFRTCWALGQPLLSKVLIVHFSVTQALLLHVALPVCTLWKRPESGEGVSVGGCPVFGRPHRNLRNVPGFCVAFFSWRLHQNWALATLEDNATIKQVGNGFLPLAYSDFIWDRVLTVNPACRSGQIGL